jgi:Na+-translocating ferredoxin:NAD+ oxidoreductase subunit B
MIRREFIQTVIRGGLIAGLGLLTGGLVFRRGKGGSCDFGFLCGQCAEKESCTLPEAVASRQYVWQLDPTKCIQCGRCATNCVLTQSAVKCTHVFAMCGYCDLCGGYFKQGTTTLNTGAENQLCPTNAIKRRFIEDPFFEYTIDEELCIGCGKCVKGCVAFGNGSLQLQVKHNLCDNCNQCSIARSCPAQAFSRVPVHDPYLLKSFGKETFNVKPG